jgi:microcystin degradation protein MlrC
VTVASPRRVAVACLMHETNTFNAHPTGLHDFRIARGEDFDADDLWLGRNAARGIVERLRAAGMIVRPTVFARAIPSGLVKASAYVSLRDEILAALRAAAPLDGVCLALHGSMMAEGEDDPEGDLLERARAELGPSVPITCALDMHATVTPRMVHCADGFAAYLTAPHLDEYETGQRAADLLRAACATDEPLKLGYARLPMLLAGEQSETDAEPMRTLLALRERLCREEGLLDASFCLGFPWADSPHAGVSVVIVGRKGNGRTVEAAARFLAEELWQRRSEFRFTTEAFGPEEALAVAVASPGKPVIVSDSGDNPTAGASQDLVGLLAALVERNASPALVCAVADPRAFEACRRAGEGSRVDVDIGRRSPADPRPLSAHAARVRRLTRCHAAQIAILDIGTVRLILSDRRVPVFEPSLIHDLGLKPTDYSVIVVKCGYQGPEYRAIAARSILALTPGDSCEDLRSLTYRRVPRPVFPLDVDAHGDSSHV